MGRKQSRQDQAVGAVSDPRALAGLTDARFRLEAAWRHPVAEGQGILHHHPWTEIVYHLRGEGRTLLATQRTIAFRRGSVEVYPPGLAHAQTNRQAGEDICLVVAVLHPLPTALGGYRYLAQLPGGALHHEFLALAEQAPGATDLDHRVADARATAVLLQVLAAGWRRESEDGRPAAVVHAQRAWAYIHECGTSLAGLDAIAAHVGISYSHLRHVFAGYYGISLKQCLESCRLEQARVLLRHSVMPQKAIGQACGFATERYFCTRFRRQEGLTPGAYRRRYGRAIRGEGAA
jgi:AraC-like DNA-binding protein